VVPARFVGGIAARSAPPATELVADAHAYIPGQIKVIAELPQWSPFQPLLGRGLADEATLQLWLPPPRFAVMSTSGVLEVIRKRPLEVLKVPPKLTATLPQTVCFSTSSQCAAAVCHSPTSSHKQPPRSIDLIAGRGCARCHAITTTLPSYVTLTRNMKLGTRTQMALVTQELLATGTPTAQMAFFQDVGAAEAACMCFAITTASTNSSTPPTTSARAEQLLSDPRFVGAPEWPLERDNAAPYGVVTDNSELDWSQMHRGLALLLFRLLGRVWELPLLRPTSRAGGGAAAAPAVAVPGGSGAVELTLPAETLAALQEQLRDVAVVALRVVEAMRVHLTNRGVKGVVEGGYEDGGGPTKRHRQEPAVLVEGAKVTAMRCAPASVALLSPCTRVQRAQVLPVHTVWTLCTRSQDRAEGASAGTTTSHGMQQARHHGG
jgi:hypothetical protein